MNTVRLQSGVCRAVVALLLAATIACSGQQEPAPVATAVATPSMLFGELLLGRGMADDAGR